MVKFTTFWINIHMRVTREKTCYVDSEPWFLVNFSLAGFFIFFFYSGSYVVRTYMIVWSDVRKRNIIYGDSQLLETWSLRFIEFMSMDCDLLTSLLLSTWFISWSKVWIRVEDVSSVISVDVFRSVDRRVTC